MNALLTDLYQLTMAQGYWKTGKHQQLAVFYLYFRKAPFSNGYALAAGLETVVDFLEHYQFAPAELAYLAKVPGNDGKPLFDSGFLQALEKLKFSGTLHAVPEGTIVFPQAPLLRVEAPLWECQLIETALLNHVNFQTLVATKAHLICRAAAPDPVLEFGLRRAQGPDGAMTASRAAFIGGCTATSNVQAGFEYGIPVKGTHAHSWVMSFDSELEAFAEYAQAMPNNCIFLVDTYDTVTGVRHAIEIGRRLRALGHELAGIRLDSGDLAALSRQARQMLDAAGFPGANIVASNDLDETQILRLKQAGAPITVWGVGTRLVTAYDQPALGGVYKLSAIQDAGGNWHPKVKFSNQPEKASLPGCLQVVRKWDGDQWLGDTIVDDRKAMLREGEEALLLEVFHEGKKVWLRPDLLHIQQYAREQYERLQPRLQERSPEQYLQISPDILDLKAKLYEDWQRLQP